MKKSKIIALILLIAIGTSVISYINFKNKYFYDLSESHERLAPYVDGVLEILTGYGIDYSNSTKEATSEYCYTYNISYTMSNGSKLSISLINHKLEGESFNVNLYEPETEDIDLVHCNFSENMYVIDVINYLSGKNYTPDDFEELYQKAYNDIVNTNKHIGSCEKYPGFYFGNHIRYSIIKNTMYQGSFSFHNFIDK